MPSSLTYQQPESNSILFTYSRLTLISPKFDFNLRFTEEQQRTGRIEYNYRREGSESGDEGTVVFAAMSATDAATYTRERPGMSAFALEAGVVYHTYSAYSRGLDGLWGMYQWLDRAPRGRNETGVWWRRHDEYDKR